MAAPVRSARGLFADEVGRPDAEIDLARAALLIAKEEYSQLSVDQYLSRLEKLAEEAKDRLDDETAPLVVLQELLQVVYTRHGFRGNQDAYYDPRNSYLNDVLDRGLGIPLSLGVVVLELGWRLGLPLEGVDFPHHFVLRFKGDALDLLIDPFDGGRIRMANEAQELLDRVYGGMIRLKPSFLRAATRRDMLVRMLRNLKGVYLNLHDDERALAMVERILLLRPDRPGERRAEGLLLARLGRGDQAVEPLVAYLEGAPHAADAGRIRRLLEQLKRGDPPDDMTGTIS